MSAGLNHGRLDAGEYATFEQPTSKPFMETLLHDCFDHGDTPDASYYREVLVEFNYGPHYPSTPMFTVTANKCSRTPKRGYDARGSYKTNLLHGGGFNAYGIPSIAIQKTTEASHLPTAAQEAIIEAIQTFDPDPTILPGSQHRGPAGDESDWRDNPFVDLRGDEPTFRLWDSDDEGVCVHTSHNKLDIEATTGIYVQGDGTPFTPVEAVTVDGEPWERPAAAGPVQAYFRAASVEVEDSVAHIVSE